MLYDVGLPLTLGVQDSVALDGQCVALAVRLVGSLGTEAVAGVNLKK
jgi:hypothetical protein